MVRKSPFDRMLEQGMAAEPGLPEAMETLNNPSWARVSDYYLNGDTEGVDRAHWANDVDFGRYLSYILPADRVITHEHRLFAKRAITYLLGQGVRQFVDLGSGVAKGNHITHVVADQWSQRRRLEPEVAVCYVDNNDIASAHSSLALDKPVQDDRLSVITADLRKPYTLWKTVLDQSPIDREQPVGLLVTGTMQQAQTTQFRQEEVGAKSLNRLKELLPSGSYIAISHVTADLENGTPAARKEALKMLAAIQRAYKVEQVAKFISRSRVEIEAYMKGYVLVGGGWKTATD